MHKAKLLAWAVIEALGLVGLVWWFALDGHPAFAAIGAPMVLVGIYGVVRSAMHLAKGEPIKGSDGGNRI